MKKLFVLSLTVIMSICLSFSNTFAEPCAWKVDKEMEVSTEWGKILEVSLETLDGKDLIIDVSLECQLVTNTLASKMMNNLVADLSEAKVGVMVRVLVGEDEDEAQPGEVNFAKRFQALKHSKPNKGIAHTAFVVLDTITANSFNFIAEGVPIGSHKIVVQAKVVEEWDVQCPMHQQTDVSIGKGSIIVDCVNN